MPQSNTIFIIALIVVFAIIIQNIYNQCKTDTFATNTISVYVFLSKTCPHCVDYEQSVHEQLATNLNTMSVNIQKIYSDQNPELFKKFQIEYVPTCVIDVNGNTVKLDGAITFDNIKKQIDKMLTPVK